MLHLQLSREGCALWSFQQDINLQGASVLRLERAGHDDNAAEGGDVEAVFHSKQVVAH